jgi:CYTH domain-containing protein/CHAD domain-containing protein
MAYRIDPRNDAGREVRRVAEERLDLALAELDGIAAADPETIERSVHAVRKHCKALRALARLVRPALGEEFGRFNQTVRRAARELSSIRDAHAVLGTFDDLSEADPDHELEAVRTAQAAMAERATQSLQGGDPRIVAARELLTEARRSVERWTVPDAFEPFGEGLGATYRRGRRARNAALESTTDTAMHEWRKAEKNLWHQMRLLAPTAPSVVEPLVDRLDDLAEALGDDHDLAVLIERLRADPERFGGKKTTKRAVKLARKQQTDLRERALRLGATVYAESPEAFVERFGSYWRNAVALGPELRTGGIAELAAHDDGSDRISFIAPAARHTHSIERERKFLVGGLPDLPAEGTEYRQGYVAIDRSISVRVRDAGAEGRTLTLKGGTGGVRVELEWPIEREEFDVLWERTEERQVRKTRYRVPFDHHIAELDVFADHLDGLVTVEVEFDDDESMQAFEPPPWFGREVTDDRRYGNAVMAVDGLDRSLFT